MDVGHNRDYFNLSAIWYCVISWGNLPPHPWMRVVTIWWEVVSFLKQQDVFVAQMTDAIQLHALMLIIVSGLCLYPDPLCYLLPFEELSNWLTPQELTENKLRFVSILFVSTQAIKFEEKTQNWILIYPGATMTSSADLWHLLIDPQRHIVFGHLRLIMWLL